MDRTEQAAGEKRVRQLLIEPLELRGLMRPSGMTKVNYEKMCHRLCQMLAYMAGEKLASLEEEVAAKAEGKNRDRMPIANKILGWAALHQKPEECTSQLMRNVFSHAVGAEAISEGWAPELLQWLHEKRSWPTGYVISKIKENADAPHRRLTIIEENLGYGRAPGPEDAVFRAHRLAAMEKCRRLADLGRGTM